MVNKVILQGRLAGNPSFHKSSDRRKWCDFDLAVSMSWRQEDGFKTATYFIPCRVYGVVAEKIVESRTKGDMVLVEGFLQQYQNSVKVIAQRVSLLKAVSNRVEEESLEGEEKGDEG